MKKTQTASPVTGSKEDLRSECRFDYSKSRQNRFAGGTHKTQVVVMLDPDVSEVFTTPEAVNKALRGLLGCIPSPVKRQRTSGK